jgi:UDP-glucose 4-epimerase
VLGWQPQYMTIESIVETAWRWHQSHPRGYDDARIKK